MNICYVFDWLSNWLSADIYIIHILLSKNYTTDTMKKKADKISSVLLPSRPLCKRKKQAVFKCLGTSTKGQELYLYMDACFVFF